MKGSIKDGSFNQGSRQSTGSINNTVKLVLVGNTTPKLANIYTGGNTNGTFTRSIGGRTVDITLQNIGGNIAEADQLNNQNYTDTDAFLLTFGFSTPTQSVKQDLKTWYNQLKRTAPKASVVLLGVKDSASSKTAVTNQDIQQIAKELHINTIAECTLDNPQSIVKAFDKAVTIGGGSQH